MAQPDFYKVLGVAETATADEIKKAYRKLAKKYHPDATGGDKAKEAKFKEISQANDTLSDEKRRAEYDQVRKNPFAGAGGAGFNPGDFSGGFPGGFPGFGGARRGGTTGSRRSASAGGAGPGAGPRIDFDDLFGGAGGFGDLFERGGAGARGESRGADVQTSLELTFGEAALGGEKAVILEPGSAAERRLTIRIPAGVDDGETIRLSGQGRAAAGGGPAGNLLIKVKIQPHAHFRRKGADVEVDVPIRIDEAVLGTSVEIETLEGNKAKVTLPAGTSSGQKLRLRGKGAGDKKGGHGDLYGIVQIQVPKKISDEARALIEQFGKLTR